MSLACPEHKRVGWVGCEIAAEPVDHAAVKHSRRRAKIAACAVKRAAEMRRSKSFKLRHRPYDVYVEECRVAGERGAAAKASIVRLNRAAKERA